MAVGYAIKVYLELFEKHTDDIEECFPCKDTATVTWVNVDGIHQVDVIEKLGLNFDLHPLIQEDILNTEQRPKMEDFGHFIYVVLRMITYDKEKAAVNSEQVSLILGKNYVISFQSRFYCFFTVSFYLFNLKHGVRIQK